MGEPAGVLLRGAHPAHSRERGPLRAEEMLGQLAFLPSHLLIALQSSSSRTRPQRPEALR